jgi:hypothetical protein
MKSMSLGALQILFISSLIIFIFEIRTAWLYFRNGKSVLRPSYYPAMLLTLILRGHDAMDEFKQRLLKEPKKQATIAIIYSIGWFVIWVLSIAGIVLKIQNR